MSNLLTIFRKQRLRTVGIVLGLLVLIIAGFSMSANAAPQQPQTSGPSDEACLYCHGKPGMTKTLPSGEVLYLTIDADHFAASVHAENNITCVQCHTNIKTFPHPELKADTLRDVATTFYTTCRQCHIEQYDKVLDSVHQKALAGGNKNAAVCTDCHNPHTQTRITDPATGALLPSARLQIPQTCARCHSTIYITYKNSVHGAALTQEGNTDVPTCIDCHGVHNIQDPTTAQFRNDTPLLCAKCHTNNAIMSKYGISTQVLNTYVSDFHGTTVTLFEETSPNTFTNKAVCTDCHGVHDITNVNDPKTGIAIKQNLLVKCQRCHPDATASFPDAWLGHYIPSPEQHPIVYFVNLFYKIMIPTVLGGMLIYVISDIIRRLIERRKGAKH